MTVSESQFMFRKGFIKKYKKNVTKTLHENFNENLLFLHLIFLPQD